MLKIKQKLLNLNFKFPALNFSKPKDLEFSPVIDEENELIQAIENDHIERGDDWELTEHPDTESLSEFWAEVQSDITKDPTWFNFAKGEDGTA